MIIESLRLSLQHVAAAYRDKLTEIPDYEFQKTPYVGGWSYSEVYSHIWDASLLSLRAMEDIWKGKGVLKPTAFTVKVILFYGAFPPAKRYKVPKRLESRVKVISKQEAAAFITKFLEQLDKDIPGIYTSDAALKTPHPRLGYLNAKQWLRFIEIHLKHHLKQIKRIEKTF